MFRGELWAHCASLSLGSHHFLKQAGKNLKNQSLFQRAIEVGVFIICWINYSECVRSFFFLVRGQTWSFISVKEDIKERGCTVMESHGPVSPGLLVSIHSHMVFSTWAFYSAISL